MTATGNTSTGVRESIREGFRRSVTLHYTDNPGTWVVDKIAARTWVLRPAHDVYPIDRFTTRKAAQTALGDRRSTCQHLWWSHDRWYLGVDDDPRSRALEPWEKDIVAQVRRDLGVDDSEAFVQRSRDLTAAHTGTKPGASE